MYCPGRFKCSLKTFYEDYDAGDDEKFELFKSLINEKVRLRKYIEEQRIEIPYFSD